MKMNVGYLGSGWLASAAAGRLAAARELVVAGPIAETLQGHAVLRDTPAGLAHRCNVVFIDLATRASVTDALFGAAGIAASLVTGTIVVDQSTGDPDETRALAARLAERGIALLDAPIHCELATELAETGAVLCGGPQQTLDAVRPLLETICLKVVHCGDTGSGHAMRIVTGAVAACNRFVTYECAAIGLTNGVAIDNLATVITQSSGYNSATKRVLPALAGNGRSADATLDAEAQTLRLAARLARRTGAPMAIATLVGCHVESAAAIYGAAATLDALAKVYEAGAGIEFSRGV